MIKRIRLKIELSRIPVSLLAIKQQSEKYINNNSVLKNGDIYILHSPWIAPLSWSIILYSKVKSSWINKFEIKTTKSIPETYREFLKIMNGCFIYDISLFGLTPSIYNANLLSRSLLQCNDLAEANTSWISEYNVPIGLFHFGSRTYSNDENIGYFIDKNDKIKSIRRTGEIVNEWHSFPDFLMEEINLAEKRMLESVPEGTKLAVN